jgi:uncharacterized membrane protein (TIGR02234 family)
MRSRAEYAAAVLLDLVGAGLALLVASRHWQAVVLPRQRPLADAVVQLTGRRIDNAPTALALVALAGVVAVIATRGWARRSVGVVLAAAGVVVVWRSALWFTAISDARARTAPKASVAVDPLVHPAVTVHAVWPTLSIVAGALIIVAGTLVAIRGAQWGALGARYERPAGNDDPEQERQRAEATMWAALDVGDDPTHPRAES